MVQLLINFVGSTRRHLECSLFTILLPPRINLPLGVANPEYNRVFHCYLPHLSNGVANPEKKLITIATVYKIICYSTTKQIYTIPNGLLVSRLEECCAANMENEDDEITNLLSEEEAVDYEKTTNYRRLITGVIVLVFVDLLWVGSAELSDVCSLYYVVL